MKFHGCFVLACILQLAFIAAAAPCHLSIHPDGDDRASGTLEEPLRTVHEAKRRLGDLEIKDDDEVHVCLSAGMHLLQQTLVIRDSDSPRRLNTGDRVPVVWRAEGNAPTTLSGGLPLTNWLACNQEGRCPGWEGVWVHYIKDIPSMNPSNLPVRELWVDGIRAVRTVVEGEALGLMTTDTGYNTTQTLPWGASAGPTQTELRWPKVVRNWIEPRCIVVSGTATSLTVDPACWATLKARNNNKPPPAPAYIENVNQAPAPGKFFADDDYIFYRPAASFPTTHTPTDGFVANMETIVDSSGVTNHTWQGVTFSYSTWRVPNQAGGYVPSQSTVSSAGEPVGSVTVTASHGVTFTNCSFVHLGGGYALSVGNASQDVAIDGNLFSDVGGGAIKIGNVLDSDRAVSTNVSDWDTGYTLSDNRVDGVAVEFHGAAAIFAGYVASTVIAHNTITNTGYTGISLGWGWGRVVSFAHDNHVANNSLSYVMQALNDGGCVYTLGPQPDSTVSGNYCFQDPAPVVGCFYHDNGSRYFTTTNNVADTSAAPCVYLQGCCGSPALNISVADLWCRSTAPVRNECEPEGCHIDMATLYNVTQKTWPSIAQDIVNNAGAH